MFKLRHTSLERLHKSIAQEWETTQISYWQNQGRGTGIHFLHALADRQRERTRENLITPANFEYYKLTPMIQCSHESRIQTPTYQSARIHGTTSPCCPGPDYSEDARIRHTFLHDTLGATGQRQDHARPYYRLADAGGLLYALGGHHRQRRPPQNYQASEGESEPADKNDRVYRRNPPLE